MENENPTPAPQGGGNNYVDLDAYTTSCEVALTNAADAEIEPLLTARGYPATTIAAKLTELANVKKLIADQRKEYGEQYEATKAYDDAVRLIHPNYIDHIDLARVAFKNDTAAKTALGLKGERKLSESGYRAQALLFYNGVLNNTAYKAAMAIKGVTEAELVTAQKAYDALGKKIADKYKETGEAQAATKARDKAIDDFADWFSDFKEVAKIALRPKPQLREKLGWKE
jgi:hypothetical protein